MTDATATHGEIEIEIEIKYDVADTFKLPLLSGIEGVTAVEKPVEEQLEATYHDTPDLALARAGVTLRRRTGGGDEGWHLKLPRTLDERLELRRPLGKSASAPPSLARLVVAHSSRGRLSPVATLRTRRVVHRLLGTDERLVAEIADDHVEGEAPGQSGTTWREIEVELTPGGGDRALLAHIGERLQEAGACPSDAASKLARVLADRLPGDDGSDAVDADDTRDVSAGELVRRHLSEQVSALKDLDPLVRLDFPDAVHKMRVTVRRLRSALATYRRLLERQDTEPLRDELRWLGALLGDARDAEVIHSRLRGAIDEQHPSLVVGPVRRRLDRTMRYEHRQAHRRCVAAMDGDRYFELLHRLGQVAAGRSLRGKRIDKPADTAIPKEVARAAARMRKFVDVAEALDAADRHAELDDALHEVRKAAKRVRYAAESATPVAGKGAKATVEAMKDLQDVLGEHQDTVVARTAVRRLSADAHAAGEDTFTWGRLHALEEASCDRATQQYLSIIGDIAARPAWLR